MCDSVKYQLKFRNHSIITIFYTHAIQQLQTTRTYTVFKTNRISLYLKKNKKIKKV